MRAVTFKRASLLAIALLFTLLLMQLLAGCGTTAPAEVKETEPVKEQTELPAEEPFDYRLGSLTLTPETESVDLDEAGASIEDLMRFVDRLANVKEISLGVPDATLAQLRAVEAAFPQAQVSWKASVLGEEIDCRSESLDLRAASDEDVPQIISALAVLPEVKTLELAAEDGLTGLSFDSLSALATAVPEAELNCRFELFGQTADWTSEKLKYYRTEVGNDGVDLFRAALPYLRALDLLRFEDCGITDNDKMAALRADFPEKRIVWSIPIAGYTFMTDTTLINDGDTHVLDDQNVELFRYMHDVLYLDIGHNHALTNIEFARNFPKLQAVILTLTNIGDISPLENCPDLEFLECHSSKISDLSALADKEKLEYLNIANLPDLRDLSPLYGLQQLKIVRICGTTFTHITKADVEALAAALPETFVSDYGGDPNNSGYWRYDDNWNPTDRYALLREQMRYDINWQLRLSNSPSGEED